jgi:retron-type reverse transcriptase
VRREVLYSIPKDFGIPMKVVRQIKMYLNEIYSKIHLILIENGLKQGDTLSPLLFNFALEYAIRKVQEISFWHMLMM